MRSRSLLAIVLMGIAGMLALGLSTKLAFDSDPALRESAKFRLHVVECFQARGVQDAIFRPPGRGRGAMLQVVAEPAVVRRSEVLEDDLADLVVDRFPRVRGSLSLSFVAAGSSGCRAAERAREVQVPVVDVRRRIDERKRTWALAGDVAEAVTGARFVDLSRDGKALRVEFSVPALPEPIEAERALDAVMECARKRFPSGRDASTTVRLRGRAPDEWVEAAYDARGRRLSLDTSPALRHRPAGSPEVEAAPEPGAADPG